MKTRDAFAPGRFVTGCNYWASHAGTRMWSDWRPEVVERDLRVLAALGLQAVRIFPLWSDFQPIAALGTPGKTVEMRWGETPLPEDEPGRSGLSDSMLERFGVFLDMAAAHQLQCVVGLLTGWMSGRLFVPPALAGRDPLTDALAIQWELRFVREFVRVFRQHPALCAWDLGNECNCMGRATREQAFVWTAAIADAIRAADPARPIISGMHGLTPDGAWTMQDQGEWTDLLTTHPYPPFTPHCGQDPVHTIRPILHAAAESRFYADLGGRPCLCEELGTLGPMVADDATAAAYLRACLFSLWANEVRGTFWWCAFDQDHLEHAPYDWCAVERELGLFRGDYARKPVAEVFRGFRALLDTLPFDALPPRQVEAVCLLTRDQDHWGVAYSAFILAKQAGFDLQFRYAGQPLPEAPIYLLPCLTGMEMLFRRHWPALLERVAAGATLYLSLDDGLPSGLEALTGLRPGARERRTGRTDVAIEGIPGRPVIPCAGGYRLNGSVTEANVLAVEFDGRPLLTERRHGKGRVVFLGVPLEMTLTNTPAAFHGPEASSAWRLYRHLAEPALRDRAIRKEDPRLALTEHALNGRERVVVAINQSADSLTATLALQSGWRLAASLHGVARAEGPAVVCEIPPCDAVLLRLDIAVGIR